MKKKLTLLALLVQFFVMAASAYDFTSGGVYYNITKAPSGSNPGTVSVASGDGYTGIVTIPATVTNEGKAYNVTAIAGKAFQNCIHLRAINIGSNITTIGFQAFIGCEDLEEIVIPDNVTELGYAWSSGADRSETFKGPRCLYRLYKPKKCHHQRWLFLYRHGMLQRLYKDCQHLHS